MEVRGWDEPVGADGGGEFGVGAEGEWRSDKPRYHRIPPSVNDLTVKVKR